MNPQVLVLLWQNRKPLLIAVGLFGAVIAGLVMLVSFVIAAVPLAPSDKTEEYKRAVAAMPVSGVPYEELVAVDAVRFHQDWSLVTPATIKETAGYFYTCMAGKCTRRSFQAVMDALHFTPDQQQQVDHMLSSLMGSVDGMVSGDCSGFVPNPAAAYTWPVSGPITACFGLRDNPTEPGSEEMHWGIDIAADLGTPVHAATAGKVTIASWSGGYGNLVVLMNPDGSMVTWYGHLSRFAVTEGQKVAQGDMIGYVGSTGRSTGPHLHFEMRPGGAKPVNPVPSYR